nr:autophagy protein 5 [Quercus suber]
MEPQIHDEPQILEPGPSIGSLLTRQRHHRSEDIRNGEDPGQLMCRGRTKEMANVQMHDNRIESHLALLNWLPANNRTETESATTTAPSTSAALVTTPTRGRRDTGSLSTSAARGRGRLVTASPSTSTARARGRPITASPSPIAARGRGRPATTSPSTSVARGRGRCATTPRVVSSLEIPAPIPHASPQPEVPPPIPIASPQSEVPPPMVDISPQPEVPSPTPPSQPSPFTPPMHPETPLYPPTSSTALTVPMDPPSIEPMTMIPTPGLYIEHHYPPTSSSSDLLGPPVGIDPLQPDIDVPDEHPPHQPSPPRGRPQRARRAPTCGTGGHKIGHKGNSMHDDEPKADAPQPPPPPKHSTRAAYIINGNCKNVMNMSQPDQVELWRSVLNGNLEAYVRISSKLKLGTVGDEYADGGGQGQVKTGRVPVRLYVWSVSEDFDDLEDAPQIDSWDKVSYINRPVEIHGEEGNYFTLQDAVKSILPEYFPNKSSTNEESSRDEDENEQTVPSEEGEKYLSENVESCYPSDNVEIKIVRIQGIEPKMEIPFSWVVKNLTNPEHYLHICVCLKVPQVL